jgi:hypothetical protein
MVSSINNRFVLAITGPSGAGKSAIGEKLAKQLDRCVNIDADHIKHMIVSGFYYDLQPDGTKKWGFREWELVGESIGLLAHNFLDHDYNVIVNGYIDEPAWLAIEQHVTINHKVLLLPRIDTAIHRDTLRQDDYVMGAEAVKQHHAYFSGTDYFKAFTRLDTTNHTVDESIAAIKELILYEWKPESKL